MEKNMCDNELKTEPDNELGVKQCQLCGYFSPTLENFCAACLDEYEATQKAKKAQEARP
jgi:hypothetical protein